MSIKLLLRNLTVRQLQLYAAVCLWSFCKARGISHGSINELFRHLVSLATAQFLPDWEQDGLKIEIIGRGNPIPAQVMAVIPEDEQQSFFELVDSCVEVGIVDMYGAMTDEPVRFVGRCLAILEKRGVDRPDIHPVRRLGGSGKEWGPAYRREDVERALREYGVQI